MVPKKLNQNTLIRGKIYHGGNPTYNFQRIKKEKMIFLFMTQKQKVKNYFFLCS